MIFSFDARQPESSLVEPAWHTTSGAGSVVGGPGN